MSFFVGIEPEGPMGGQQRIECENVIQCRKVAAVEKANPANRQQGVVISIGELRGGGEDVVELEQWMFDVDSPRMWVHWGASEYSSNPNFTAQDVAGALNSDLAPLFAGHKFKVRVDSRYKEDSVYIEFARTKPAARTLDVIGAPVSLSVAIESLTGIWAPGQEAHLLKAVAIKEHNVRFYTKAGTPEDVVQYVVRWFTEHREELTG
jgi:hypothetical protein